MKTTPHGWSILDAEAAVLSFSYNFSKTGQSNCITAKLPSGGLVIISPPSQISDEAIADLAAYGPVEAIVANNGFHYLGIATWRKKFPQARCFAAEGASKRIAKRSKDTGPLESLATLTPLLGNNIAIVEAPTTKCGETWARAKIENGYAWYASDILANIPTLPPNFIIRALFKYTKSAPGYRIFNLAVSFIIKDKKKALKELLNDLKKHPPTIMVPAHGDVLTHGTLAAETIKMVEDAL